MLTGFGHGSAGISYSELSTLNIALGGGNDTFTVKSTAAGTATNIEIPTTQGHGPTTITTLTGADTISLGSLSLTNGGNDNIQSAVIVGDGNTTLNVYVAGSQGGVDTLTSTALTGKDFQGNGVSYSGLSALNVFLGSGVNTFNVLSTHAGLPTTIYDSAAQDVLNIGSLAPASGGILTGIQGALKIVGDGSDSVNVDDSGSNATNIGTLGNSSLTGLGMGSAGITYSQLGTLNLFLGRGATP